MALAYWGIVLKGRFVHLDLWIDFVQVNLAKKVTEILKLSSLV